MPHKPPRRLPRPDDYPALAAFLDGYLHQDFRQVHGGALLAAAAFARDAGPDELASVCGELAALQRALTGQPLAVWRSAVSAIGGAWRPSSSGEVGRLLEALEEARDVGHAGSDT